MIIDDDNKEQLEAETYSFLDQGYIRQSMGNKVTKALEKSFPIEWGGVKLVVKNIKYKPQDYDLAAQKKALLEESYLSNPLKGDLYLYDSKTGELLDEVKNKSLLRIPFMSQRGTIAHNGSEYSTLRQLRLRPGVYSRKKSNGELETQFNIERGTGQGYRVTLDPSSGLYKLNVGQSSTNLYSILHDMGVADDELLEAWGPDLFKRNKAKYDARALEKVHSKFVGSRNSKAKNRFEMAQELKEAFDKQRIDADIKSLNLGI